MPVSSVLRPSTMMLGMLLLAATLVTAGCWSSAPGPSSSPSASPSAVAVSPPPSSAKFTGRSPGVSPACCLHEPCRLAAAHHGLVARGPAALLPGGHAHHGLVAHSPAVLLPRRPRPPRRPRRIPVPVPPPRGPVAVPP